MSFLEWLERDRSDPNVPTPTAAQFADAQARIDEGEERDGDEALTFVYNDRVLVPAQRKYEDMVDEALRDEFSAPITDNDPPF